MNKDLERVCVLAARIEEQQEEVIAMLAGAAALVANDDTANADMLLFQAMKHLADKENLQKLRKAAGGDDD
ncbi:MAG: hypothetical protein EPN31_14070 [Castellaniella sp.]|uniref:hypothetical protein n=1 Tax=Castellaniella sp. TaxID=1955812 RepID=UPI001201252A|nr:hypothetical protein [Castellaniella sp.]TAN26042.1 MAG: hypothetical protein EPN31_14070 [Castellaniella sp.]